MALSGSGLSSAIKDAISALSDDRDFDTMWDTIADAIVTYITANAVVAGPVIVTSVAGVTTGAGVSGAGTGSMSTGRIT